MMGRCSLLAVVLLMRRIVARDEEQFDSHGDHAPSFRGISDLEPVLVETAQLVHEHVEVGVLIGWLLGSGDESGEQQEGITVAKILGQVENHARERGEGVGSFERLEAVEVDAQHDIPSSVLGAKIRWTKRHATASTHDEVIPRLTVVEAPHGLVLTIVGRHGDVRQAQQLADPTVLEQRLQTILHSEVEEELHSAQLTPASNTNKERNKN